MAPGGGWRWYRVGGLSLRVYTHPCVYEPAEDSFLAVRLLQLMASRWRARLAADLGAGTGILGLAASKIYGAHVVATDINPYAVEAARLTLGPRGSVARCRWATCIGGPVDLAVVNPPYLPVEDGLADCGGWLEASWSGGPGVVEEACREAARVAGRLIIVYSTLTGWGHEECFEEHGIRQVGVLEEAFFMERIVAVAGERHG